MRFVMRLIGRLVTLVLNVLEHTSLGLGVLFFAIMTGMAFSGVIMRYFFQMGFTGQTAIMSLLMTGGVFLGVASVTRDNSHIRISFFADKLLGQKRAARVGATIENIAGVMACGFLTYQAVRWVLLGYRAGAPFWMPRLILLVGMALLTIFYTERLVRQIIFGHADETEDSNQTGETEDI